MSDDIFLKLFKFLFISILLLSAGFFLFVGHMAYKQDPSLVSAILALSMLPLAGLCIWPVLRILKDDIGDLLLWIFLRERYDSLPHFGRVLDKEKTMEIISKSKFSPYITKEIHYEIRFLQEVQTTQVADSVNKNISKEAENAVQEFCLDEAAVFGSEEIQEFTYEGLAYKG